MFVLASDNFWSAFCVFHAHFWEKTHRFKICALKKRNDFRQIKKIISEWWSAKQRRINQSSWTTWPIRLWILWGIVLWKEILCKTWIVFILIKFIIMLYNQNKSCVKSCQKHCSFTITHWFPENPIVFQHVHFFIPLFWNEKLSLVVPQSDHKQRDSYSFVYSLVSK